MRYRKVPTISRVTSEWQIMKTCEGVDVEKKRESFTSSKLHHVYKRKGLQQCNRFMGSDLDFASFVIVFLILGHLSLMP